MPGPGNYAQDGLSHVKSAPKFGFGTSKRGNEGKKMNGPGPGNYSMHKLDDMPKFSMGVLTTYNPEKKEAKHKPGPGKYSPEKSKVKSSEPSYTIGKGTRRDHAKEKEREFQADPGAYDPNISATKMRSAGWRIGTDQRKSVVQKGQEFIPGAGSYSIASRIDEGRKVTMHSRLDQVDQNVKRGIPGPG